MAPAQNSLRCDVLVIGGGTGGVGAALQSARSGARTILCEEGPWLGGMLSAAGVSATDGNHRLPSGLWQAFREALYAHYGGPEALATGWVSNTQFEPHVADSVFKVLCAREQLLSVRHGFRFEGVLQAGKTVQGAVFRDAGGRLWSIRAGVTIDATELGDVMARAGAAYRLGVDARAETGEVAASQKSSSIIQDLTWAAVLKDYGPGVDKTLPPLPGYQASDFYCCCVDKCARAEKVHPCSTMLSYARLPRGKIMINWPLHGNDVYLNVVEADAATREKAWQTARAQTLHFIRYLQEELGYRHLGLADDEFPTADRLPLMAYHREGRRVKGLALLTTEHLTNPYAQPNPLYRTGIAVGDYPLDHHHAEAPEPVEEQYPPIPSFNIPLGVLIPERIEGLIVAEKGISVTHLVNGASRLQPCVLLTGQAAGALAARSVLDRRPPRQVSIRAVQQNLLDAGAFLMPYLDVSPKDAAWQAVQRCGAAGLLRGKGIPHDWANETWFYPDSGLTNVELLAGLQDWQPGFYAQVRLAPAPLSIEAAADILDACLTSEPAARRRSNFCANKAGFRACLPALWHDTLHLSDYNPQRPITRRELAVLLDVVLRPFLRPIDWRGHYKGR